MTNHLYFGDNLGVLRESIRDESVDLVYLDPPFNSNATYNILYRAPSGEPSQAQIEAFEDTWHWNEAAERAFDDVMQSGNAQAATCCARCARSCAQRHDGLHHAHLGADAGAASRTEADRLHLPALRPDGEPLSQGYDGCGVWRSKFSQRDRVEEEGWAR